MTAVVERMKPQLLALSVGERAELAYFLLRTLEHGEDVAEVLDAVLERRLAEIDAGGAKGKPAERLFAELREKYT